jgi:hypothetical protein
MEHPGAQPPESLVKKVPARATLPGLAAIALLACAGPATSASISWATGPSAAGAAGHLAILTNGSLVEAIDLGGTGPAITVDPTGLNLVFTRVDSPFFTTTFADSLFGTPNNVGDAGWSAVLDTAEYSSGDVNASSFLSGLVPGSTYQVQFFSGRSYPNLDNRLLKYGDGLGNFSPEVSMGQNLFTSMVGTFTADATTQAIVFEENVGLPTLNAYVLREITPIPEPDGWALMLAGLAVIGPLLSRRAAGRRQGA